MWMIWLFLTSWILPYKLLPFARALLCNSHPGLFCWPPAQSLSHFRDFWESSTVTFIYNALPRIFPGLAPSSCLGLTAVLTYSLTWDGAQTLRQTPWSLLAGVHALSPSLSVSRLRLASNKYNMMKEMDYDSCNCGILCKTLFCWRILYWFDEVISHVGRAICQGTMGTSGSWGSFPLMANKKTDLQFYS
jgi:hypothetical protein